MKPEKPWGDDIFEGWAKSGPEPFGLWLPQPKPSEAMEGPFGGPTIFGTAKPTGPAPTLQDVMQSVYGHMLPKGGVDYAAGLDVTVAAKLDAVQKTVTSAMQLPPHAWSYGSSLLKSIYPIWKANNLIQAEAEKWFSTKTDADPVYAAAKALAAKRGIVRALPPVESEEERRMIELAGRVPFDLEDCE